MWESQALLRAEPLAGDVELGERFVALIDPLRYPAAGLDAAAVREIRRIKARVEAERLPRGVDPARNTKLGPGGLADVEWTVQLLQLQHARTVPGLRTTRTLRGARCGCGRRAARRRAGGDVAARVADGDAGAQCGPAGARPTRGQPAHRPARALGLGAGARLPSGRGRARWSTTIVARRGGRGRWWSGVLSVS